MKKKIIALLAACSLSAGLLAACGGGATQPAAPAEETTEAVTEAAAAPTEETTEAVTEAAAASTEGATEAAAPAADAIVLKLGHNNPAQGMTGKSYDKFAEYVAELSGGQIVVETYPGGTLVDDSNSFDSVMDGSVDFIHDTVNRETGRVPDLSPLEIPGYYTGAAEDWVDFAESLREPLSAIYEPLGIKYIASNYQGTTCFVSGKKEIASPEDMQGMSVRAMGNSLSKAVSAWGGAPTALSLGELSTALERGTVDAAVTGWTIAIPNAFYEIADHMTYTQFTETHAILLMNLDTFNSLTEEQQGWIMEAGKKLEEYTVQLVGEEYQPGIDAATAAGCNVLELTDEQNQAFADLTDPLFEECRSTLSENGLALLDKIGK